jgi:hypothetical protein
MLKQGGHSSWKAMEILLDAKRGDELSLLWIRKIRVMLRMGVKP